MNQLSRMIWPVKNFTESGNKVLTVRTTSLEWTLSIHKIMTTVLQNVPFFLSFKALTASFGRGGNTTANVVFPYKKFSLAFGRNWTTVGCFTCIELVEICVKSHKTTTHHT
jgi:hypothetical protein